MIVGTYELQFSDLQKFLNNDFYIIRGLGIVKWNGCWWDICYEENLKTSIKKWLGSSYDPFLVGKFYKSFIEEEDNLKDIYFLNNNKHHIVFNNGTYNLITHNFQENVFYKNEFTTKPFKIVYDNSSINHTFEKYLNEVMCNDKDLINLIQEMMGYCLTDSCAHEMGFLLYGEGATGKSILLKTISNVWGDSNCSKVPFNRINEKFMRGYLYGKKVNFSTELESSIDNTDNFKKMVSGEDIEAEFKFKDSFTFQNTAKMIFAMNNLPVIKDKTSGTMRRITIIPFENSFKDSSNKDIYLIDKILLNKSGIINFAIEGLKRLEKNKTFTKSVKSNSYKKDYEENNDTVFLYINENCKTSEDSSLYIIFDDLYENYKLWCIASGFTKLNKTNLLKNINRLVKNSKKIRKTVNKIQKYVIPNIDLL